MNANWNDITLRNKITVEWRGTDVEFEGKLFAFDRVHAWLDGNGEFHTTGALVFKPVFHVSEELHLTLDQAEARAVN